MPSSERGPAGTASVFSKAAMVSRTHEDIASGGLTLLAAARSVCFLFPSTRPFGPLTNLVEVSHGVAAKVPRAFRGSGSTAERVVRARAGAQEGGAGGRRAIGNQVGKNFRHEEVRFREVRQGQEGIRCVAGGVFAQTVPRRQD